MGSLERRLRHRESLRRDILDAATALFADEGYERVTMRRIAERIEYSPTTIYLHFTDKNELLAAVCAETFRELAGRLQRLQASSLSPLAYLRDALRAYVEFGLEYPHQYRVAFLMPGAEATAESIERSPARQVIDLLRQGLEVSADNGDLHVPDAATAAQALWAAVHGLTSALITMEGFPFSSRAALTDQLVGTLISGLRSTASVRRAPVRSKPSSFFD